MKVDNSLMRILLTYSLISSVVAVSSATLVNYLIVLINEQSMHNNKFAADQLWFWILRFHLQTCTYASPHVYNVTHEPLRYKGANIDVRLNLFFRVATL